MLNSFYLEISLIVTEGRPSHNAENNEVIVQAHNYNPATNAYYANGRMALLKAPSMLQCHVYYRCHKAYSIQQFFDTVTLPFDSIEELQGNLPFFNEVDIVKPD